MGIHKPQIHAPRIGVPTTLLNRVYHNPAEVSVDSYNVHVKKPVPNPVPVEVEVLGEPIVKHVEVEGAPIVEHKYAARVHPQRGYSQHIRCCTTPRHCCCIPPRIRCTPSCTSTPSCRICSTPSRPSTPSRRIRCTPSTPASSHHHCRCRGALNLESLLGNKYYEI